MYYNTEIKINLSLKKGVFPRLVLVSLVLLEDGSINCCVNIILQNTLYSVSYLSPLEG